MNDDRREKRKAFEEATTHHRAYYERYFPTRVLGSRAADPVTPEVLLEIERLKTVRDAAKAAWDASVRA